VERVGTYGFAFITRGHVHDSCMPGWVESEDSIQFLHEVLDLDPLDVATKFEQWACARDRSTSLFPLIDYIQELTGLLLHAATAPVDSLQNVRAQCTHLIADGLSECGLHLHLP
jgi:hypothetical protein